MPRTCLACHGVLGAESSPFFQTVLHRAVLVKSQPFPLPEGVLGEPKQEWRQEGLFYPEAVAVWRGWPVREWTDLFSVASYLP